MIAPLRILAASDFYLPRQGGIERVIHETARRLPGEGVEVEVLTYRLEPGAPAEEVIDGIPVHRVGGGPRHLAGQLADRLPAARRWAAAALGRFDLVHAHLTLAALPLLAPLARLGRPLVATFYGPWHREYEAEMSDPAVPSRWPAPLRPLAAPLVSRLLFALQSRVLARAARVIVLSEHSRGELIADGFPAAAPIETIPGGVDVERFAPRDRAGARARFPPLAGRPGPLLVTVRRLVSRMGLGALLDAAARLRPSYPGLTLAVGGVGPLGAALEGEARRLGIGDAVRFLGRVAEEDLPDLYAAADLVVMPTRDLEGFGIPVLESWASGVPVVATPVGALKELVGRMGGEWLCEGTGAGHLARGIAGGLGRLGPGASERARALALSYRWEDIARRTAQLYRAVAAPRPAA